MSGFSFYAGANSENGFVSYYGSIDSDLENIAVYNIVGGPGTGKSSLMKKLSVLSENNGWRCEKYFCSSDPNSLDAIRLISNDGQRKIVVCDATAPHPRELSTPGAVGRLIDLTQFWDRNRLMNMKSNITYLQESKRASYISAYGYLKLAGAVMKEMLKLRRLEIDKEKLNRYLSYDKAKSGASKRIERPIRCISMFGENIINNNGYNAKRRIFIENPIDCTIVAETLVAGSKDPWIAPHPVVNSICDEVFIPSLDLCISTADRNASEEFDINEYATDLNNQELLILRESYNAYVNLAVKSLSAAKECHFQLEEIYGNAMDFTAKEEYDNDIMKDVSSSMA